MDIQALSDRAEIEQLLARYCHVLDGGDWPALRALFTLDASVDYSAFGGPAGDVEAMVAFLQEVAGGLVGTQHLSGSIAIEIDGDRATVRSAGQVVLTSMADGEGEQNQFIGLWYADRLSRTADGWRFAHRLQERAWMSAVMPG